MIDLGAELLAALRSDAGRAVLADALRPVVADAVRGVLAEQAETWIDNREAAAAIGRTPAAFRMLISRRPDLARLSSGDGRARRWRRSDLERWQQAQRAGEGE